MTKFPKQFKLTVPQEAEGAFKKLPEIADRENRSMTEIVVELIESYVRLHEPGNPQQRLDVIVRDGKAYHADQCTVCGGKPVFMGFEDGVQRLFCRDCFGKKKLRLQGWREI